MKIGDLIVRLILSWTVFVMCVIPGLLIGIIFQVKLNECDVDNSCDIDKKAYMATSIVMFSICGPLFAIWGIMLYVWSWCAGIALVKVGWDGEIKM